MTDGRRCERKVVRRLHASFSGSPWVGNGLDGELAQLVPQAGLTSAQTDAVIPTGTPVSSRSRSLKAEFRRRTTFHSCTPMAGQVSQTVWHTFAILRIKSRQTPLFEPGSATFCRTGYRFRARPIFQDKSQKNTFMEGGRGDAARPEIGLLRLGTAPFILD